VCGWCDLEACFGFSGVILWLWPFVEIERYGVVRHRARGDRRRGAVFRGIRLWIWNV